MANTYEQNLLEEVVDKLMEVDIVKWTHRPEDDFYKYFITVDDMTVAVASNQFMVKDHDSSEKRYSGSKVQELYSSLESRRKEQVECLPLRKLCAALDKS
jgi:hypothetical protein